MFMLGGTSMSFFSKIALARRTLDRGEVELAGEIAVLAISEIDDDVLASADRVAEAAERIHADDLAGADEVLRELEKSNQGALDDDRANDREALKGDMKDVLDGTGAELQTDAGQPAIPQASVVSLAGWLVDHASMVADVNADAADHIVAAARTLMEVV